MAGASAPEHLRKAYLHATGGAIDEEEDEKQAAASGSHPNRKLDSLGEDCPVYVSKGAKTVLTEAVTRKCPRMTTRRAGSCTMRCRAVVASVSPR